MPTTKQELEAAVAQLATREELWLMKAELQRAIREDGEETRRYMKLLFDEIKDLTDHYTCILEKGGLTRTSSGHR